jgi:hypothetical protein
MTYLLFLFIQSMFLHEIHNEYKDIFKNMGL